MLNPTSRNLNLINNISIRLKLYISARYMLRASGALPNNLTVFSQNVLAITGHSTPFINHGVLVNMPCITLLRKFPVNHILSTKHHKYPIDYHLNTKIHPKAVIDTVFDVSANSKSNKEVSEEIIAVKHEVKLIEKSSTKTLQNSHGSGSFKPYSLSGLKGFPEEWKTGKLEFKIVYKKCFITVYVYIIYTLGLNKMYSAEHLFEHVDKLIKSIVPVLHDKIDYKLFKSVFLNKYMGTIQHHLVSLFKNKKFKIEYFREFSSNKIDYNLLRSGNMLNIIEAYVFKKTLWSLLDKMSFVAVKDDSVLLKEDASIFNYDCDESQKQAGQMHVDWVGVKAISSKNGQIELCVIYKDTKMYDSNAVTGRITLIPEFYNNAQTIHEYLSKTLTGLQQTIAKKNLQTNTFFKDLLKDLLKEQEKIKKLLKQNETNMIKYIVDEKIIEKLKQSIEKYNQILLNSMTEDEIAKHINWGLTVDAGKNEDFINFYETCFKSELEAYIESITEKEMEALHRTEITPENEKIVQEVTERLIVHFPEEIRENARRAIEYINKS